MSNMILKLWPDGCGSVTPFKSMADTGEPVYVYLPGGCAFRQVSRYGAIAVAFETPDEVEHTGSDIEDVFDLDRRGTPIARCTWTPWASPDGETDDDEMWMIDIHLGIAHMSETRLSKAKRVDVGSDDLYVCQEGGDD